MEIILKSDFPSLGYVGDVVKVRPGYARNYLIPRGIGLELKSGNANALKHRVAQVNKLKVQRTAEARELATKMEELSFSYQLKAGSQGKSFGSITAKDIEDSLKEAGYPNIERKQIRLLDPIKAGGEYKVGIKLHTEVTAMVKVVVGVEKPVQKAEAKEAPAKRGRKKAAETEEPSQEE